MKDRAATTESPEKLGLLCTAPSKNIEGPYRKRVCTNIDITETRGLEVHAFLVISTLAFKHAY